MNMKFLKTTLAVLILTGAVVGVLLMIFQTQRAYQTILVKQSQEHLEVTAKSIAKSLEEFISMQKNVLKSLATDPLLLAINQNTDYAQLEMRYKELKGDIGGFYIISPQGIVTHRYPNKNRVGKDFSKNNRAPCQRVGASTICVVSSIWRSSASTKRAFHPVAGIPHGRFCGHGH